MKFFIHTYGCQMNVHDSERMAENLRALGYSEADSDAGADIVLFNTCTVREHAQHKAISEIGRVIHRKKRDKGLVVGVCGCVAQKEKENLFKIYPELDIVFGPDQIWKLEELLAVCGLPSAVSAKMAVELVNELNEYNWEYLKSSLPITHNSSPITRFVTIMKGCNNHCAFCIVPKVRGKEVSRPADDIIDEVKRLVAFGVKEVTLLGQNVNSYSPPLEKGGKGGISPFVFLVQRISSETDILRIRYTSPHPKDLGDDLIEEHANNPKLCAHMHLPLQAGSDAVLRMMKRSYNKSRFIERALKLRSEVPGVDITTDIIVGFPGETGKDYQDTLDVVRKVAFDGMFAFKYSPRPGTRSAEMEDDVPMKVKDERLQELLKLNSLLWKDRTARLIGTTQQVLVEGPSKKQEQKPVRGELVEPQARSSTGVSEHDLSFDRLPSTRYRSLRMNGTYGPGRTNVLSVTGKTFANKIVNFSGNLELVGHIVPVRITSAGPNSLKGEMV